ncbi:MAG: ABC-F family ATP-binding cassette domain-containing protein [Anaerolineae bacterium]|nr:ABC-F family ATP-binding cassette domain-containing protein [Anaerolineae bacterium]
MSILTATNLAKSFGVQDLFWDVNVSIAHGDKIALVGSNGEGKTTLLRLLMGLDQPSAGSVSKMKHIRIGYLAQNVMVEGMETPLEICLGVFDDLQEMQGRLRYLESLLADPEQGQEAMEKYGKLLQAFEHAGGYEYPVTVDTVLSGLGIDDEHRRRPMDQLSGGQRTRVVLARLLLEEPHILILDEPTNHLDLQAIEWLEQYLQTWKGTVLVVSHDRYFMDHIATKIWDLRFGTVEIYHGNYSHYVRQREERIAHQMKAWELQQKFIAKEASYIRRYMAGQRTAQAQGRQKRLARLERLARPSLEKTIKVDLGSDQRSGDLILRTNDLVIGYDRPLVTVPDLELRRLHRVALIGPNGSGKTTFLKTILGHIEPIQGWAQLGASLQIGYMSQTQEELNNTNTIVQEVEQIKELPLGQMRDFLARFLFIEDDVFKQIGDLSGGERCRVILAKLTLAGTNFLVLDEPTNQLDIPSQEILEAVFKEFIGTILIVSHDRYLIDRLATQVWVVQDGQLCIYEGDYQEYLKLRAREQNAERERIRQEEEARLQRQKRERALKSNTGTQQRTIDEVEAEIAGLEQQLDSLGQALVRASAEQQLDKVRVLGVEYEHVQVELEQLMAEWVAFGEANAQPDGAG